MKNEDENIEEEHDLNQLPSCLAGQEGFRGEISGTNLAKLKGAYSPINQPTERGCIAALVYTLPHTQVITK